MGFSMTRDIHREAKIHGTRDDTDSRTLKSKAIEHCMQQLALARKSEGGMPAGEATSFVLHREPLGN